VRPTDSHQEAVYSLLSVVNHMERRWLLPIPTDPDRHAWEPLPFWDFIEGLDAAAPHVRERTFLDVGCGIGTKLALAYHLGWRVSGIDYHQPYIAAAEELCEGCEADLRLGDAAATENFEAGLVYSYRILRDDAACDRLEEHIVGHCTPGTVVYFPQSRFRPKWGEPVTAEIGVVR